MRRKRSRSREVGTGKLVADKMLADLLSAALSGDGPACQEEGGCVLRPVERVCGVVCRRPYVGDDGVPVCLTAGLTGDCVPGCACRNACGKGQAKPDPRRTIGGDRAWWHLLRSLWALAAIGWLVRPRPRWWRPAMLLVEYLGVLFMLYGLALLLDPYMPFTPIAATCAVVALVAGLVLR